jgi:hypothetical protein
MCCGRERISSSENVEHTSTANLSGPLIGEVFMDGADIDLDHPRPALSDTKGVESGCELLDADCETQGK